MANAATNMQVGAGIDRQTLWDKIGYEPHSEGQASIHASEARFMMPCCGRRYGKSQSAGHWMTENLFMPDTWHWIVGPSYSLGEKEFRVVWDDIFRKLKLRHPKIRKGYNVRQGNMYIELPWNTVLEVKSADRPDESLVGEGLTSAVMSEAAKHKSSTWERYIEPALSDHRGKAMFPTTPEGFNWYKDLWDLGADPSFPDYESWQFPTWENTVRYPGGIDDPEIQRVKRVASPQWFDQEYGAKFTSFAGMIYDEFSRNLHVKEFEYVPAWRNYWAMDFGFADPFICLDIMVDQSDNWYIWREYYVRYRSTMEHGYALRARENPDGFHVTAMFGDPRGADEIATLALIIGQIYARSAELTWKQGVEAVKRQMRQQPDGSVKLFIHPRCVNTIKELEGLRVKKPPTDVKNATEGQLDKDDHTADALRYFACEFAVLGGGRSMEELSAGMAKNSERGMFRLDDTTFTGGSDQIDF